MAELKLDYYKGTDLYSDGDIENEILELAAHKVSADDLTQMEFPILYHLSQIRENILNWYPFRAGASVLEIGAGCGAITGLLCQKLSHVVSADLSKRRAEINYTRHKAYDNLEIWVGNLNDMEFECQFDYVVLNGVFEYARGFTEGEQPYETFLDRISRFLKPDGVILIAIENRLGLKYFAGAPEDHTNGYYDGIREYEHDPMVRTFSKGEWERLMQTCGFAYYKFYYPYPDYKFPKEIFTDESLKKQKYGVPTWNFTEDRMALFEETKMAAALQREGLMAQFANSFLIEMSRQPLSVKQEVLYAKLSNDRDSRFAIATVIEEREGQGRIVRKTALSQEGSAHVKRMLGQMGTYGAWQPLAGREEDDGIVYPYLQKKSLGQQAEEAIQRKDWAHLKHLVDQVKKICSPTEDTDGPTVTVQKIGIKKGLELSAAEREQFRSVFGAGEIPDDAVCISPANLDLILDNIFESGEGYEVIDCEWVFEFPIPVSFLIWRTVNDLYSSNPHLEKSIAKAEFLLQYGIREEESALFWSWATHFAEVYVGANRLLRRSIPEIGVSLEEFRQQRRRRDYIMSQLFIDTGDGFSEESKLTAETKLREGRFTVSFDLQAFQNIQALRFDPLEGSPCICRIDPQKTAVQLKPANAASETEEGDLFLTTDPVYLIRGEAKEQRLTISGQIRRLTMEEVLAQVNQPPKKGSGLRFWRR